MLVLHDGREIDTVETRHFLGAPKRPCTRFLVASASYLDPFWLNGAIVERGRLVSEPELKEGMA